MPINYSNYPPNWLTEIRPRILNRANHRCEFCGVPNYSYVFRGKHNNSEVYQFGDGSFYSYPKGELIDKNATADIHPINGDVNQKAIKIILTIAHLDHDSDNHNVKDERLKALCQKCHLRYDAKDKQKKRISKKYKKSLFPM